MELLLRRVQITPDVTIGELLVNGEHECWVCEDPVRDHKIAGVTAIPEGTYNVVITFSNRFQRDMPLLEDVPEFSGIRIHTGNTPENTEGGLLVGQDRREASVGHSVAAYNQLYPKLVEARAQGEAITITITNED
mgnify:CR=1 FL=1